MQPDLQLFVKDQKAIQELIEGSTSLKSKHWGAARYQFRKLSDHPQFGKIAKHWICQTYVVSNQPTNAEECYKEEGIKADEFQKQQQRAKQFLSIHPPNDQNKNTDIVYGTSSGRGDLVGTHCSTEGAKGFIKGYRVMCKKTSIKRTYKACSGPVTCGQIGIAFAKAKRWYISDQDRALQVCAPCL